MQALECQLLLLCALMILELPRIDAVAQDAHQPDVATGSDDKAFQMLPGPFAMGDHNA
jgi:hypothetical protein